MNDTKNRGNNYAPAADDIATAVDINKKIICSASLIAVRILIIDNAPTRPSDNARLDLIIITITKIEIVKKGNRLEKTFLLENVFEYVL